MVVPLFVGREKSIAAIDEAMRQNNELLLCAQKKAKTQEPAAEDIFTVGTLGNIIHPGVVRLNDGTVKVLVEGKRRARIRRFVGTDGFFQVEAEEPRGARRAHPSRSRRWCAPSTGSSTRTSSLTKRIPARDADVGRHPIDDPRRGWPTPSWPTCR